MKNSIIILFALIATIGVSRPLHADETSTSDVTAMKGETVGIKPQAGIMGFNVGDGSSTTTRLAYGATVDLNLLPRTVVFLGPSSGLLYSNIGSQGANLVGSSLTSGTNTFLIPLNGKLGVNLTSGFRLSAHGGANYVHRSDTTTIQLGNSSLSSGGSDSSFFPNVGADAEFSLSRNIGLILRPDVTIANGNNMYTATAGLSFILG